MGSKDYIALAALFFSVISFGISLWIQSRTRKTERRLQTIAKDEAAKTALLQALQGEKESVGFTALYFARKGLPDNLEDRERVILALVQAAIFAGSDRARAMVYAVLRENLKWCGPEIRQAIDLFENQFRQFDEFDLDKRELDLDRAYRRLGALKKVLNESSA